MNVPHLIPFKTIPTLSVLKSAYPALKGIFFDMDGTLFNTESHHAEAFMKLGTEYKIRLPHTPEMIFEMLMGKADHLVYEVVKEWDGFPKHWSAKEFVDRKNNCLLDILKTVDPATYFPGELLALLHEARTEKFFLALVTSSEKIVTRRLLELTGLADFFDFELTRDDCPNHKPDPWPYLHAIKKAGLAAHEVLIFEDSHVGLAAASGSGAHVIKVEWY